VKGKLVVAGAVLAVAAVALSPVVKTYRAERASLKRVKAALDGKDPWALNELTDDDVAQHAEELAPRIVALAREKGSDPSVAKVLDKLVARGCVGADDLTFFLDRLFRVTWYTPSTRYVEKGSRELLVLYTGQDRIAHLGSASGRITVTTAGKTLATRDFALDPGSNTTRSDNLRVDLADLGVGKHVLEIRFTATLEGANASPITIAHSSEVALEVVPGDWKTYITLVQSDEAKAAAATIDVGFGSDDDPKVVERDLRLREGATVTRYGNVVLFYLSAAKPLPCWLHHWVMFEVGERRLPSVFVTLRPGETRVEPWKTEQHYSFPLPDFGLPAGRYPLRIVLRPSPENLLVFGGANKLDLYGGELVFERTLVIEPKSR
jgi:hypothetical protein